MGSYVGLPLGSGSPKPFVPASFKQTGLIQKLLVEKQVSEDHKSDVTLQIEAGEMSKGAASKEITFLFSQPKAAAAAKVGGPKVEVGEGFYWSESTQQVFKVVKSKAGHTYAKVMVPAKHEGGKGTWEYAPGAMNKSGEWNKMDGAFAATIGKKIGYCCCCGAMLTDPNSIAAGIGPVCAKKYF